MREIACRLRRRNFWTPLRGGRWTMPGLVKKRLKKEHGGFAMKSAVGFMGKHGNAGGFPAFAHKEGYRCYLFSGGKTKALSEGLKEYGVLAPALSGKALEAQARRSFLPG